MVFFTMCIVATTTDICIKGVVTIASQSRVALIIHYDGNGRNGIDHGHGCIGYHRSQMLPRGSCAAMLEFVAKGRPPVPHRTRLSKSLGWALGASRKREGAGILVH